MKLSPVFGLMVALGLAVGCSGDDKRESSCLAPCGGRLDGGTDPEPCDCGVDGGDGDGDGDVTGDAGDGDDAPDSGAPDAQAPDAGGSGQPTCSTAKAPDVTGLDVQMVVGGLSNLVYAAQPKGSSDWYLVDQTGVVRVLRAGTTMPSEFLNLTGVANSNGAGGDERGLLSIAFPPDYATSGLFYVMLTPTSGADQEHDLVLRYKRSAADPYVADTGTREVIVDLPKSATNHNGGTALFGPDGLLYVGTGDGGGGCNSDKPDAPQDVGSPHGKILRLDPSKSAPYAAAGNPFTSSGDARVLHYGVRNPFRFGFDRVKGDLYIGDVGQSAYEEINFAPKGSTGFNFGWAALEGAEATCPGRMLRAGSQATPPIVIADRRPMGCTGNFCDYKSIIGGVVYRGAAIEKLRGAYLFGDYVGKRMGALYQCGQQTSPIAILRKQCDDSDEACLPRAAGINELTGIVEGSDGEVYLVASRSKLLKLISSASP